MTNIPDKVSRKDLDKLLEVPDTEAKFDGYTTDELITMCQQAKDAIAEKCKHPMAHKVMAMLIMDHFINFHESMACRHQRQDKEVCLTWAKDVGSLEAARRIFADVSLGADDWFVDWDFESTDDICPDCRDDS